MLYAYKPFDLMVMEIVELMDENNKLKLENAKLREFVYDMWNDMNVYYTQHESPDSSDMDFYRDRMCELGIEVESHVND